MEIKHQPYAKHIEITAAFVYNKKEVNDHEMLFLRCADC